MSRSYTDRTLKLLWGRSGGRCAMPDCRVELFAEASDYDPLVIIGEIAHQAAANDGGPRADTKLTSEERNSYDNLTLLCQNCHARIDGQSKTYSAERLKEIKADHEAWVRASLPERGRSRTGWTLLSLQGDHMLDIATADESLTPDFIADIRPCIRVPTDTDNWQAVDVMISSRTRKLMTSGDDFDRRIAVYPLAPVSACVSFGYHLTNRPHVRLFQYHRDDRTWAWPRRLVPAQDIVVSGLDEEDESCQAVAFLFHYSAIITDVAIMGLGVPLDRRVDFRVQRPSTAWLQHPEQIKWAAFEARQAFEQAVQLFPHAKIWHLFYAGPSPVGVAIGQQINPTMCPIVQLYEYRHKANPPYQATIRLGERL
jgi:hypothetical protein